MFGRKKKEKKEATPEELVKTGLQQQVDAQMNLWRASAFGANKSIETMLTSDSPPNVDQPEQQSGMSALALACQSGHLETARLLIFKGRADVNLQAFAGRTALHQACANDHLGIIQMLVVEAGARTELQDQGGNTALLLCARGGNVKAIKALLDRGANLQHVNKSGMNALMIAILHNRVAVVEMLLSHAVNPNHKNQDGNTALHIAARCGYLRLVKLLLPSNAQPDIKNKAGQLFHEMAPSPKMAELIQSIMAGAPDPIGDDFY